MPKVFDLVIDGKKRCSRCRKYKAFDEFYKDKTLAYGLRTECIICRREIEKGYYHRDKSKSRARFRRYLYGIEPEDFERMWEEQGRACKMCGVHLDKEFGRMKNTCHVDHDHETGKVRGLLCLQCNSLLGMAQNRPGILLAAMRYLKENG